MKLPLTPEEQAWLSKQDAPRKGTAAHDRGKHCIEAFNKWSPVAWPEYRKLGWRCVPVMVHPMETPTKSTKRTK